MVHDFYAHHVQKAVGESFAWVETSDSVWKLINHCSHQVSQHCFHQRYKIPDNFQAWRVTFWWEEGSQFRFNKFKVNLFCFGWKLFQWLNSESICGLMAEPQVAYPNPGEKSGPVVRAHDHQPGIECFGAGSVGHGRGFGQKVLQARAVSSSGGSWLFWGSKLLTSLEEIVIRHRSLFVKLTINFTATGGVVPTLQQCCGKEYTSSALKWVTKSNCNCYW